MKNAAQIMMLRATGVILSGLLGVMAPQATAQQSSTSQADQQASQRALVEQFFPQRLSARDAEARAKYGGPSSRQSAFVAADLDRTGKPQYLVAAYTADEMAAIRVLKVTDNSAALVDEPNLCPFGGRDPEVSLINLDRSGNPAVLVSLLAGNRGEEMQWVFKWDGSALKSIGPGKDDQGLSCTDLFDADFVDLDGDGILEIVNSQGTSRWEIEAGAPETYEVYKLIEGAYKLSGMFEYFGGFPVPIAPPPPQFRTKRFVASAPGSPYIMTIANGNGRDEPPVQSAQILLNGEAVTTPGQISQTVRSLKIPVTVKAKNTVVVNVSGPQGSALNIGIGPAALPKPPSANSK